MCLRRAGRARPVPAPVSPPAPDFCAANCTGCMDFALFAETRACGGPQCAACCSCCLLVDDDTLPPPPSLSPRYLTVTQRSAVCSIFELHRQLAQAGSKRAVWQPDTCLVGRPATLAVCQNQVLQAPGVRHGIREYQMWTLTSATDDSEVPRKIPSLVEDKSTWGYLRAVLVFSLAS